MLNRSERLRGRWIGSRRSIGMLAAVCIITAAACAPKSPPSATPTNDGGSKLASSVSPSDDQFDATQIPGRIHLVQPNDTLWTLSEKYYGNSRDWRRILVANRRRVTDPTNLPVGMKLIIP